MGVRDVRGARRVERGCGCGGRESECPWEAGPADGLVPLIHTGSTGSTWGRGGGGGGGVRVTTIRGPFTIPRRPLAPPPL